VSDPALEIAEARRTTPVELLWDLVFVLAVTQVMSSEAGEPSSTADERMTG
jgi:low temperature requirement protein LtrA